MADIFDEIAARQTGPRDIFDEVADKAAKSSVAAQPSSRDLFDEIADRMAAPSTVEDLANRFRRSGAVAIGNTLQAIPRLGHAVARALGADLPDAQQQQTLREESPMFRLGEDIAQGAVEAFPVDPRRDGSLVSAVIEGAGGMVPTIASGGAGRVAAALQYGLSAGEQAAQEAVAEGRPETATTAFLATAPLGAITEGALGVAPGVARALREGVRKPLLGSIVRGAAGEGLQEGLEQVGGNIVASDVAGYDPERPVGQGVPTAMAAGAILGGGVNAGVRALQRAGVQPEASAVGAQNAAPVVAAEPAILGDGGGSAVAVSPVGLYSEQALSRRMAAMERVKKAGWKIDAGEGELGVFWRSGPPPESGRSYNHKDNFFENGVSVYPRPSATSFAGLAERDWYRIQGKRIGTGSDGEPLVAVESAVKLTKQELAEDQSLVAELFPKPEMRIGQIVRQPTVIDPNSRKPKVILVTEVSSSGSATGRGLSQIDAPRTEASDRYIFPNEGMVEVVGTVDDLIGKKYWRQSLADEFLATVKRRSGDLGDSGVSNASAVVEPMVLGDGANLAAGGGDTIAMPPVPAGIPIAGAPRMPVAMERIVEGTVDMPTVMASLESAVQAWGGHTPLRTGRFTQRARGIYNTQSDLARLNSADNLPTATHEVGHALAEHIWGNVGRAEFRKLPRPLRDELMTMGRALYGNTKPAGGYLAEGWAEFVRLYLTTEDAPARAPGLTKWFESTVLPTNPAGRKALEQVRDLADTWRGQGARARALAQMKPEPGRLAKLREAVGNLLTKRNFVDDAEPLRLLSKSTEQIIGHRLPVSEDPYLLLSAKRGTAGAILDRFLYDGPVDAFGNRVARTHGLQDALAPITANVPLLKRRGKLRDFSLYLWTRRAQERWSKNQNPGISLDDATYLRTQLETPAFELAADRYYRWWDSVLDYFAAARPENADLVQRIRAGSSNYAPLARVLEPGRIKPELGGKAGGGLARMHGSGLPIKDIFESTISVAQRLIERAHRDMVLESILQIAQHRGTGVLVEEVPRSRVEQVAPFGALRKSLEDLGLNTQGIPDDDLVSYWSHAVTPRGSDPIVARKVGGQMKWFHVQPEVYEILEGMEAKRLGPLLDLTMAAPVRLFKLSTTGIRPSFALTNMLRDLPTMLAQTVSDKNAVQRLGAYLAGWGEVIRHGLSAASAGKVAADTPLMDVYQRLGLEGAQWLGNDANRLRKAKTALVGGRIVRRIINPIETLRDIVNASEVAPRLAELRSVGADLGWSPGQPLTPDQAVAMAVAARRITTDFAAGGRLGRQINQVVPFWNAAIQGTRGFLRAASGDRDIGRKVSRSAASARFALTGLLWFMLPALVNWWRNKDEPWYHALPWRERFLYTNVLGEDGVVVQVPRSQEWGSLFMALPEALFDSAYHQDPTAVVEAFKHVMELLNPFRLPMAAQVAKEQWQNRIDFFNRPIVPEGERFLRPGEQRGPYTSWLAEALGDAFPDAVSPRRVDHLVRSFLGATYSDLAQVPGMAERWQLGNAETSDLPVVGRLFRRGGQYSAANQNLMDVYDLRRRWISRRRETLSAVDQGWVRTLNQQVEELQAAHRIANQTRLPDARRRLYERMNERALRVLDDARRSKRLD